ncbi:hypothetical protein ES707_02916 [subsurface metagenome]
MTTDLDICFLPVFQENLNKHFPETDDEELKRYVKERICCAVNALNSIGNTIKIEKIFLTVHCNNIPISIDFDDNKLKYGIACLEVPPQIIVPLPNDSFSRKDLIETFDSLKNYCNRNPFSHDILCHEFGHLQDAQRSGFDYEKPKEELLPYIDMIWNVLLESKFSKHGIALKTKDENRKYFLKHLEPQWFKPPPKDFEDLWGVGNYTYKEIRERAQKYYSSPSNLNQIRG